MVTTITNAKTGITVDKSTSGVDTFPVSTSTIPLVPTKAFMQNTTLTANEWVKRQIDEWGFDYVEYLFAVGYEPTLTASGWRWVLSRQDH